MVNYYHGASVVILPAAQTHLGVHDLEFRVLGIGDWGLGIRAQGTSQRQGIEGGRGIEFSQCSCLMEGWLKARRSPAPRHFASLHPDIGTRLFESSELRHFGAPGLGFRV